MSDVLGVQLIVSFVVQSGIAKVNMLLFYFLCLFCLKKAVGAYLFFGIFF